MSDAIRRDWPYTILISSLLVLLAGLALPRLGRWAALGAGSLAVALSGVVLIVFAVAGKDSTAPHCIPFRSPTWYHLGDLAIYGVTFAALSLSAAIAAAIRREHHRQSIAIGLLATAGGTASFFVLVNLAICGA
jgi:hypothetical protein